ncbi:MAG: hypothetical protein A2X94_16525 [Bdellovibrionales bacterium GWB1_55_8]|nr:MAG: hypothetical protein A2X94_16525 [Bdellovibrionales bacterium GWB1_55_8]
MSRTGILSRAIRTLGFFVVGTLAVAILTPGDSAADVTVTPVNAGGLAVDGEKDVYYGAITATNETLKSALFDSTDRTYYAVDITKTQDAESGGAYPNRLLFDVVSTGAKSDGKQLLLTISIDGNSDAKAIPISSVGDGNVACDSNLCQDEKAIAGFSGTRFYAVKYTPGTRLRVGIYPAEACLSYDVEFGTATGCSGSNVEAPAAAPGGEATELLLTFSFATADTPTGPATGTAQEPTDVTLHFQVDRPKFVCADLSNVYFPGDGEIALQTDGFGIVTENASALSGRAPATTLLVLGNDGAAPDLTSTFATGNKILARLPLGGERAVTGFDNATASGEHEYDVSFMMRDASGMLAVADYSSCKLENLQTSGIDSFLKNGNCFIATAAFRTGDAAPVRLLREFRDRVLLRFPAGRAFVRAYYRHSPDAAKWLQDHPLFRGPVLLALTPLELVAWLLLHPLAFALLLGGAAFSGGALACEIRRKAL